MKEINTEEIHPSIKNLLSFATKASNVEKEYNNYLKDSNRKLFILELNEEIVGCIGYERIGSEACAIKHIAVSIEQRGKGIGSKMIDFLLDQFSIIFAETDNDAVNFYKNYGFVISSLGEKYPGVERFLCEYRKNSIS